MLGENIKAMRESKGLSQEELAVKLNVVRQTVSKWERGRKTALVSCVAVFVIAVLALTCLAVMGSGYLAWDLSDPEIAVAATVLHGFEWLFIRVLPVLLIASIGGFCLAWRRR